MNTEGRKYDKGKIRYSLIPWEALRTVVYVLEHGASKYGAGNWKYVPYAEERYKEALGRHFARFMEGQTFDADSRCPHIAHIATNALFLLYFMKHPQKPAAQ